MEKNDLDKYVQKVLEIQQEQKKNLSQEELKAVALSIGLTESDWEAVEKSLADNLTRGEGFLKYQNWADAIEEFQNCQTIRPMHLESLLGLTKAHFGVWKESGSEESKMEAVRYGESYLNLHPSSDDALQIVSSLKKTQIEPKKNGGLRVRRKRLIATTLISFLIGLGITLMFLTFSASHSEDPPVPPSVSVPDAPATSEVPEVSPPDPQNVNETSENDKNRDLSVIFKNNANTDFEWQLSSASWEKFVNESTSWSLMGGLKSPSNNISRLFLKLDGFNINGEEIFNTSIKVTDEKGDMIRKNDFIPIGFNDYNEKGLDLAVLEISVESIKQETFNGTFEKSPPVSFTWDIAQPNNIDIEVRERFLDYGSETFGLRFHKHILEVKNIGNLPIKVLKLRHRWFLDDVKEPFKIAEEYIVSTQLPPIKAGQTFVKSATFQLEGIENKKVNRSISVASVEF